MPNIKITLNSAAATQLADVCKKLQDGSKFAPTASYYIKLVGGLHVYDDAVVRAALEKALHDAPQPPSELAGTFLEWELSSRGTQCDLVLAVDLQGEAFEALGSALLLLLPRGRVFQRPFQVVVGSVKGIDEHQRDDFLAAVRSAFPPNQAAFACATLEYDPPKPQPRAPPSRAPSRPPKPAAGGGVRERQKAALRGRLEALHEQIGSTKGKIAARSSRMEATMDTTGATGGKIKKQRRRKPKPAAGKRPQ